MACEVIAINRSECCAILDTGHIVHFATMLNIEGDETDEVTECVCAVAPLPDGNWAVIDFSQFESVQLH